MSNINSSNSDNFTRENKLQAEEEKTSISKQKLGIALVGLGRYSEQELVPALKETNYCELKGLVSGHRQKLNQWKSKYNLQEKDLYQYDNFDAIKSNNDIDIVYVVLPNSLHAEFVIRAARAGKHVICEKPMATNVEDSERMIAACQEAGVKLSIGYRLHFDPFNQEMMRLGQSRLVGKVKTVIAKDGFEVGDKSQWRLNPDLAGGGPLMDVGIYCVQGVLYTLGELPIAVTAKFLPKQDPEKFPTVEETMEWEMEFASGTRAFCQTSYREKFDLLRAETEKGYFELEPAYAYRGLKGRGSEGPMNQKEINQQAAQMDDFAWCIKNNHASRVPGEMGLRDMYILMAIYESAKTGKKIALKLDAFRDVGQDLSLISRGRLKGK